MEVCIDGGMSGVSSKFAAYLISVGALKTTDYHTTLYEDRRCNTLAHKYPREFITYMTLRRFAGLKIYDDYTVFLEKYQKLINQEDTTL